MLRQVVQVSNVMSQFGDVPTCYVKDINKIFLPFRRYSNFTQNFGDVPTCNVTSKNLTFFPFGDIPTQQFGAFPTFFFGDSNVNRLFEYGPFSMRYVLTEPAGAGNQGQKDSLSTLTMTLAFFDNFLPT